MNHVMARDVYGRRYRVGEDAEELTGHSRRWQLWAAWACMVAISPLQYSFGAAALGLESDRGWGAVQTLWLLAIFVACQALVAVPAAWLQRVRRASATQLVVLGGVLSAVGLATLAHADSYAVVVIGYALLGGIGAGIVYAACITTSARWFPDRRTATIGFVTGGFAIGAVPSIAMLTLADCRRSTTCLRSDRSDRGAGHGHRWRAAEGSAAALVAGGHRCADLGDRSQAQPEHPEQRPRRPPLPPGRGDADRRAAVDVAHARDQCSAVVVRHRVRGELR